MFIELLCDSVNMNCFKHYSTEKYELWAFQFAVNGLVCCCCLKFLSHLRSSYIPHKVHLIRTDFCSICWNSAIHVSCLLKQLVLLGAPIALIPCVRGVLKAMLTVVSVLFFLSSYNCLYAKYANSKHSYDLEVKHKSAGILHFISREHQPNTKKKKKKKNYGDDGKVKKWQSSRCMWKWKRA